MQRFGSVPPREQGTSHIVIERTQKCVSMCKKVNALPMNKMDQKGYVASAIVLGGTLCGAEVDHLTKNNLHNIRDLLGSAIWGNRGPRNIIAALLLHKKGSVDRMSKEPYNWLDVGNKGQQRTFR